MELIKWAYTKRYNIKGVFTAFPNSAVIFRPIKNYYFIYTIKWSMKDPVVTKAELEKMELILNRELGTEESYRERKILKN